MRIEHKLSSHFKEIQTLIKSPNFIKRHKQNTTDFTRKRKLTFHDVINHVLSVPRKNTTLDLQKFIDTNPHIKAQSYSKQAFSKARSKIKWKAFEEIFDVTTKSLFESSNQHRWKGYQILAIDGTTIQVPQTEENGYDFGINQKAAMGYASTLTDVRNNLVVHAELGTYKTTEAEQARRLLCKFWNTYPDFKKSIVLFDRGYCSYSLIDLLCEQEQPFVIRIKKNMTTSYPISEDRPVITQYIKKQGMKKERFLTIYRIDLENEDDEPEYLLTNLNKDIRFSSKTMKELYGFRWGIECKYKELKTRIHIEAFTGVSEHVIYQDFFASLLFSNISAYIKNYCDKYVRKNHENCKYKYQTNLTSLMVRLKEDYLYILLGLRSNLVKLKKIINLSKKDSSLIRPNRKREHATLHPKVTHNQFYKTKI